MLRHYTWIRDLLFHEVSKFHPKHIRLEWIKNVVCAKGSWPYMCILLSYLILRAASSRCFVFFQFLLWSSARLINISDQILIMVIWVNYYFTPQMHRCVGSTAYIFVFGLFNYAFISSVYTVSYQVIGWIVNNELEIMWF